MKHRKPNGAQRAVAGTSMPLAAAAVVATLLAAPAGAVPNEPTTPTTPAPAPVQPGTPDETPETPAPQPGAPAEEPQEPSKPTPSQPGVTTPDPDEVKPDPKKDPKLAAPTQPGVTTPRVAPLPVPGQQAEDLPAAAVDPADPNAPKPAEPGTPAQPGAVQPKPQSNVPAVQPESQENLVQEPPRWQAPRLQAAPAAPVVEMEGPRTEVSANVDGGALIPGFVANTHHFNNQAGYVGTIGYRTPTGAGEAGVSVEYLDTNSIKITSYTGGEGLADNKNSFLLDTTQANAAKSAVEQWIAAQPGGAAALEAAARVTLPSIIPAGDVAPQTVNVGGITTQWGGSVQY
ncbi:hypothetical protein [Nocardia goodfellowii]|uniref:Uncharacterized protein n=1 Tax=Nocardia goodfellowii TaxID=882446 RepID=A0ABS4Q6A8_9NOCA|nr:hypothetical protein [Nocardia goodfellowii]MBP2187221.1 hypothetical protein [Nocardia goodfellowii]